MKVLRDSRNNSSEFGCSSCKKTMSMLKVWSEDECLYLDYEDEDEFFLVKNVFFNKILANFQVDTTKDRFRNYHEKSHPRDKE